LSCYTAGQGTAPPPNTLYFPVGLAVSKGGNVLYAVNSDFDLQWNGGTLQSYDLDRIRRDAVLTIADPANPALPRFDNAPTGACPNTLSDAGPNAPPPLPLGETCAPPMKSESYVRDSVVIGAFATDLQLSKDGSRLFVPVRGDATLTWADVAADAVDQPPPSDASAASSYAAFHLDCGTRVDGRCDAGHHAGSNPNEPGNTRHVTMPGEPFGMAQSDDGSAIVITHQTDTKTTLLASGLPPLPPAADSPCPVPTIVGSRTNPSIQFVLDGVAAGGNGIAAIPHDLAAYPNCDPPPPRPAFLETSRAQAELDLLRYYSDQGTTASSSLSRPFLIRETTFPLTANAGGSDSRGIVIDDTPRRACKAMATTPEGRAECARLPARVYFANRTPASLLLGEIGEASTAADGPFDADRLTVYGNVPLSVGPSRMYLAPIVDRDGAYALRLFIVCFDSATLFVYDPEAGVVENIIRVGLGPFAMAFDPFDMNDVALHKKVDADPRAPGTDLKKYRFAYIASFTNSFVQVIDLDNNRPGHESTYEKVVFTLGNPTAPKGTH